MAFARSESVNSPTGARLKLYVREADGEARAVVQINHGLAEHAARYAHFAEFLAGRGFHVYAHDHRGHGGTTAPDAPPRSFGRDGAEKVIADAEAVHDLIAARHPGLPVILFGHSMGGLIAANFVIRHSDRIGAAAIWNANFTTGSAGQLARLILAWERFRRGSDVPSRVLPELTFRTWAKRIANRRTDFDWLSRDEAEVDRYIADPLCGWDASVGMWRDIFRLIYAGANRENYRPASKDLPIQLVGGEWDPATSGGRAVRNFAKLLNRAGFSNLQTTVYPQTRHESLNELNRDLIMAAFADWAEKVVLNS